MAKSARWEGYEVVLDNDTVRFGDGEHDWVKPYPYPESEELQPLKTVSVFPDGRFLLVSSEWYLFTFHSITEQDGVRVFNYRWRRREVPLSFWLDARELLSDAPH